VLVVGVAVGRLGAVAVLAVLVVGSCSSSPGTSERGDPGSSSSVVTSVGGGLSGGVEGQGSLPVLPAGEVVARAGLAVSDEQRVCVEARLVADPGLVAALGDDPQRSPRAEDLGRVVAGCSQATTMADLFADQVVVSAGGAVSEDQRRCLREGYAALGATTVSSMVVAGLNPEVASSAGVENPLFELARGCGVDPELVRARL
jgi:hypothetical protein